MIKLISSKVEDISKTEKMSFFTVIYLGFYRYLSIKTLKGGGFETSGRACLGVTLVKTLEEKTQQKFVLLQKKVLAKDILPEEFPGSAATTLTFSLILATCAVHVALFLDF